MFSRKNLSSKYKIYVKTLSAKNDLVNTIKPKINKHYDVYFKAGMLLRCKQCINSIDKKKDVIFNKNTLYKYKKTLHSVQTKLLCRDLENKTDSKKDLSEEKIHAQWFSPYLLSGDTLHIDDKGPVIENDLSQTKLHTQWFSPYLLSGDNLHIYAKAPVKESLKVVPEAPLIFDSASEVLNRVNAHSENNLSETKVHGKWFSPFLLNAVTLHIDDKAPVIETLKVVEPIPEPPPIPDAASEILNQVNALGEPTFASLGLGGWSPIGIIQTTFEYLHVTLGIPWWGAIVLGTVVIRLCMFPLVVIAQRNAARMNNYLPQLQVLQLKMTEARQSGNQIEVARYSQELMLFMKEKEINPFKNMLVPLAQMPIFISFFMGLRQMANVPVDSMRDGGLFWFKDLTVPDQYLALPIITSLTLWATIELGTDSAKLSAQNLQVMKYVLRALPFVILPFTVNFPGAILCYWVASNFISLGQVAFLRIPTVRDYFRIEVLLKHNAEKLPIKSKGFIGGIKDSWTNIKITKELEERRRLDELQFQRAGKGPAVKTYKYDPTKQVSNNPQAVSAKKR